MAGVVVEIPGVPLQRTDNAGELKCSEWLYLDTSVQLEEFMVR